MIKNVLIFVGGYGKRLGNLTKKTPKPLLLINSKPFINYLLEKIVKIKPKNERLFIDFFLFSDGL
jgi:NDP-sugar pyrophosphorylase family protein